MTEALEYIKKQQKELSVLGGIGALLGWDQMTYMPPKGAQERSEQSGLLSKLSHKRVVSDELWKHIQKLAKTENFEQLDQVDKSIVKRLKKDVEKARKVPTAFVERFAKTTTLAYPAWHQAREKADFTLFLPHLERIVELEKEYCRYIDLPGPAYNNLLDDYEEGMTVETLKKEFFYLKSHLITLLECITDSDVYKKQIPFEKQFPVHDQKEICNIILNTMKLPDNRFRMDESTHPFTTSMGYDDVRITTSYERKGGLFSFFSTVHEAGHALYELSMPRGKLENTVLSDSPSLGLHESQSRFWENMIARSQSFWTFFYPKFKQQFSQQVNNVTLEQWYSIVNQVKPSYIRVEADELTYCLHVILRFELETLLIEGKIEVKDLPHLWNEKMNDMLGIIPPSDKEGVLQDMHWSGGSFGYFPTYAIGSIYAAQLYQTLTNNIPDLYGQIEQGDFSAIITWLQKHIHEKGRSMTADKIIQNACGQGLHSQQYFEYLKTKYSALYCI